MNQLIATDLYQQGNFKAAERFVEEARVAVKPATVEHFTSLPGVLESLAHYNLEPALRWCAEHEVISTDASRGVRVIDLVMWAIVIKDNATCKAVNPHPKKRILEPL